MGQLSEQARPERPGLDTVVLLGQAHLRHVVLDLAKHPVELLGQAVRHCREAGVPVCFDASGDGQEWPAALGGDAALEGCGAAVVDALAARLGGCYGGLVDGFHGFGEVVAWVVGGGADLDLTVQVSVLVTHLANDAFLS